MPQISQRVSGRLAKVVIMAAVSAGAVVGCDDSRVADRRVNETLQQSRLARLKEDGLEQSRALLNQAAKETEANAATRAHVKSLLGHAQMDAANAQISDPENGVNRGNREIARLLWEIGQLAQQMQTSNMLAASYAQFEPAQAKEAAAALDAAATGAPDQPIWVGENTTAIPTIAAAQQKVAQLQDEIAKQQQAIAALQQQRTEAAAQAEQLARQSEAQPGRAGLETFRSASETRKKAADTQNQIDVESAKLARLQQDAALAQTQLQAVSKAREQFQTFAKNLDESWASVQAQVEKQKSQAAEILAGKGASSITSKAAELAKQADTTKAAHDAAETSITEALASFDAAGTDAAKLTAELRQAGSTLTSDSQLKKAMDQLIEVYNPNISKLAQANATLALAQLQASRAQVLAERAALVAKLGPVVQQAGLALPAELNDPKLADDLKAASTAADESFVKAQELYTDVSQGGGGESARNAGRAGHIYALYGRALLGRATGNASAAEYLSQAQQQRDVVLQESKSALAALPAELVVLTATTPAPATTTTDAAATAPATEGAATEGAATEGAATAPATDGTAAPTDAAPTEPAPQ